VKGRLRTKTETWVLSGIWEHSRTRYAIEEESADVDCVLECVRECSHIPERTRIKVPRPFMTLADFYRLRNVSSHLSSTFGIATESTATLYRILYANWPTLVQLLSDLHVSMDVTGRWT